MPSTQAQISIPRGYLSHTQIACVLRSEKEYIRRYVYGVIDEGSIQQEYGKTVTDVLEGRTKCPKKLQKALADIPTYKETDKEIKCKLKRKGKEIILLGRLDGFSAPHTQGEYKTGMQKWTQKRVQDCLQLKIYALIHYKNTGEIPEQKLTWLQTEWDGAQIKLTGINQTFQVKFTLKDLLETEGVVWRAHDRIIGLLEQVYAGI